MNRLFTLAILVIAPTAFANPTCVVMGHYNEYNPAPLFDLVIYNSGAPMVEVASALNLEDAAKGLNDEINSGHCVRSTDVPVCTLGSATTGSKFAIFLIFDTGGSSREVGMVTVPWSANHPETTYFQDRVSRITQLRDQIAATGLCKLDSDSSYFSFEKGAK